MTEPSASSTDMSQDFHDLDLDDLLEQEWPDGTMSPHPKKKRKTDTITKKQETSAKKKQDTSDVIEIIDDVE
eukprot:48181-Eustigmatos_ZCMA.PRE.1